MDGPGSWPIYSTEISSSARIPHCCWGPYGLRWRYASLRRWHMTFVSGSRAGNLERLEFPAPGKASGSWRPELPPSKVEELVPNHSITSSARASSVGGISSPSILAVPVLMTNSNLFGCTTGRSAGLAPLRMRPV